MARFLTSEWFTMINDRAPTVDPNVDFVLEQRVLDGPRGDVSYSVMVGGGRVQFGSPAAGAHAVLTLDYGTACALATGRLTAQDAFLQGRVRFTGDLTRVQAAASALAILAETLAAASGDTTY